MLFSPRVISELRWPTAAKFFTMLEAVFNFIIPVQKFWGSLPKKFQGPKTCKIWPDFGRLQSSAASISGTNKDIQNRTRFCSAIPPALGDKISVNFGPLITEIKRWNRTHPNRRFLENHISVPRGCCAPKFLHAPLNDQVLLAHSPPGTPPPYNFLRRGSKIALKFNVWASKSSELGVQPNKALSRDVPIRGVITPIQLLGGHRPLKIWDGKNRSKLGSISDDIRFDRECLWNETSCQKVK